MRTCGVPGSKTYNTLAPHKSPTCKANPHSASNWLKLPVKRSYQPMAPVAFASDELMLIVILYICLSPQIAGRSFPCDLTSAIDLREVIDLQFV